MAGEQGQESGSSDKPFRLSSYLEGTFQPNGSFTRDRLLSADAVKVWEDENQRLWDGKAWGMGQALFFRDKPLTFGRNTDVVDVKIDADPTPQGISKIEMGVSRRHFSLQPPQDKKVKIDDLDSTNGVWVLDNKPGPLKITVNKNNPTTLLEVGDYAIFGGGEPPNSQVFQNPDMRMIGFRVCEDSQGKIFLVKFNAHDLDDLLALSGRTQADISPARPARSDQKLSRDKIESFLQPGPEREALTSACQILVEDIINLRSNIQEFGLDHTSVLSSQRILFTNLFTQVEKLANKYFKGDWTLAAGLVGKVATDEAQRLLDEKKDQQAKPALDVALLAFDLSHNRLMRFTTD